MQVQTHHIHFRCLDPKKTQTYYVDILGATNPGSFEGPFGWVYTVECHGYTLFFASAPVNLTMPAAAEEPHWGVYQLAWRVDDLAALLADIKAKGGVIKKDIFVPRPGWLAAFVAGPDGVELEFVQY